MATVPADVPLARVEDLRVVYQRGAQPAVDGVSFTLGAGEGLLITGERGSGKSSVLRALLGLVRFGGLVAVAGAYPGTVPAVAATGYGPQGKEFPGGHSPRRLVSMVGALKGIRDGGVVETALERGGVPPADAGRVSDDPELVRHVSLACALLGEPAVLVLDDPWEFPETFDAIAATRARGGAVIVASHDPGGFGPQLGRTLTLDAGRSA